MGFIGNPGGAEQVLGQALLAGRPRGLALFPARSCGSQKF